jgi:hypothetical protein
MKKRIGVLSVTAGTLSVFLLLACGGGGGSSNPPPVYTGIASPAALNSSFEAGQFTYALIMPSIPTDVVPLSSAGSGRRVFSSGFSSIQSLIRGIWDRTAKPARPMNNARPMGTYPLDPVYGAEGGAATITVYTGVWSNQVEYVTRITAVFSSFDDTMDGISNPFDGTMTIVPDAWTGDGMPVYFVASFDLHAQANPALGARMAGSMGYHQVSPDDPRIVYTYNALLIDDNTGIEIWGNPLIEIDEDYLSPSRALLTVSGRIYVSSYGYVDVSTLVPLDYPSVETDLTPVSGSVRLVGKGTPAVTADVTVSAASPEVQVDIDRNGDAVPDETGQFSWNELIPF